ncbi:MAG: phosphate acyltransferase PlsX [Aphanocapsa feldmannii 288cV]|nr:MAG: phosphate acyltransferase PlsX [Aphanocapsa feldmannii 288cV]
MRRIRRIRRLSRRSRRVFSLIGSAASDQSQRVLDPLRRLVQGVSLRRMGSTAAEAQAAARRTAIAVDGMGGDFAPEVVLKGCLDAIGRLPVRILFSVEPQALQAVLAADESLAKASEAACRAGLLQVIEAGPSISMDDEPTAVRRKRTASINLAMGLVKSGEAAAIYSAGNSGAVMASAIFRLGRLRGIDRPAIGALFPTKDPARQVLVLDVGANMDCKPVYLKQFAQLGSIYSTNVLGIRQPRVGLLNIGEEDCKGNDLTLGAYPLLAQEPSIRFSGNCEGRDVLSTDFDVVVCDGFSGNVLLKFLESVASVLLEVLKAEIPRGRRGKVGAAFLRGNLRRIKKRLDHAEHGGALLLGVDGICVVGHGSSSSVSVVSAIRLALTAADNNVMEQLHQLSGGGDSVVTAV